MKEDLKEVEAKLTRIERLMFVTLVLVAFTVLKVFSVS